MYILDTYNDILHRHTH